MSNEQWASNVGLQQAQGTHGQSWCQPGEHRWPQTPQRQPSLQQWRPSVSPLSLLCLGAVPREERSLLAPHHSHALYHSLLSPPPPLHWLPALSQNCPLHYPLCYSLHWCLYWPLRCPLCYPSHCCPCCYVLESQCCLLSPSVWGLGVGGVLPSGRAGQPGRRRRRP